MQIFKYCWGVLLLPLLSYAGPAVGDTAEYSITITANGQNSSGTQVVQLVAYDSAQDKFQQQITTTISSGTKTEQAWVTSAVLRASTIQAVGPKLCETFGGKIETANVPAGIFITCNRPVGTSSSSGNGWYGSVPMGLVRLDSKLSGTEIKKQLTNYHYGESE